MQQCFFFAVKLQKCFVDYKTSPDFPSAWGPEDIDYFKALKNKNPARGLDRL